jgi:hypothetical protein
MSASPLSFALPSKPVSQARQRDWYGASGAISLKTGWSAVFDLLDGAYCSGSPAKVTPLTSTVSRLRQNAP